MKQKRAEALAKVQFEKAVYQEVEQKKKTEQEMNKKEKENA